MKLLLTFSLFAFIASFVDAQPCKTVKPGMSQLEVLKLAGKPTEVDSLGSNVSPNGKKVSLFVWQYGDVRKVGNQRVQFQGDKVVDVIAEGKTMNYF